MEKSSSIPSRESRVPSACPLCKDNPGWLLQEDGNGIVRARRCSCSSDNRQSAIGNRKLDNAGFRSLADLLSADSGLRSVLRDPDQRVAEFLETRKGKSQAVTSREIAGHLWPGTTMDVAHAEKLRREVCASIERLRRRARLPICASKEPPVGYFMPATKEELKEMHDRLFSEGIGQIILSQLYAKDADLTREFEGQMHLQESEVRSQESA